MARPKAARHVSSILCGKRSSARANQAGDLCMAGVIALCEWRPDRGLEDCEKWHCGMPPALRNHRQPIAGDTPASIAASPVPKFSVNAPLHLAPGAGQLDDAPPIFRRVRYGGWVPGVGSSVLVSPQHRLQRRVNFNGSVRVIIIGLLQRTDAAVVPAAIQARQCRNMELVRSLLVADQSLVKRGVKTKGKINGNIVATEKIPPIPEARAQGRSALGSSACRQRLRERTYVHEHCAQLSSLREPGSDQQGQSRRLHGQQR